MVSGGTRRIVVIKDIPSNIIEEAILILKADPPEGLNITTAECSKKSVRKRDNDFLLKEAESIIGDYIKESKLQAGMRREAYLRKCFTGGKIPVNIIINTALAGSILLLIFLIAKIV